MDCFRGRKGEEGRGNLASGDLYLSPELNVARSKSCIHHLLGVLNFAWQHVLFGVQVSSCSVRQISLEKSSIASSAYTVYEQQDI